MAMEDDGLSTLDVEMSKDESRRTTTSGEGTSSNPGILGGSIASATGNKNQNEGGRDRSNRNPNNEEDECDEKWNVESLVNEGSRGANGRRVAYFYDCES